jgi:O-antigen/teichoic acid export membrane protein
MAGESGDAVNGARSDGIKEGGDSRTLGRKALSLGSANALDYAIQFLLPIVLARTLDVESFGQYRLLWLGVSSLMVIAPLAMPQSLYFFLPRSDVETKRLYVNQTLLFMGVGALLGAWLLSPWNPWLPEKMQQLVDYGLIVPAFVFLWMLASLLDLLPTVEERVAWQARATLGLSALRALALSAAAILTGDLSAVLTVLFAFVVFKTVLLLAYVSAHHGLGGPVLRVGAFCDQIRHAAPFGISGGLHGMRSQANQWVAAGLFNMTMFASFSVASVLSPMVNLFRQSVNHVFLPSMSRQQAAGDLPGMLALNNRANVMVATLVFPLLAMAFAFAGEIISIIYTDAYIDAAAPMRVYIIGMAAYVVELTSIMLLMRQGAYAMTVSAVVLPVSVLISWLSALQFGLAGAAAGSVVTVYLDRLLTLLRISSRTGIPVHRLQDWAPLALLAIFAACSGALAWATVGMLHTDNRFLRLGCGGVVLMAAYLVLLLCSGGRRRWMSAAEDFSMPAPAAHPESAG